MLGWFCWFKIFCWGANVLRRSTLTLGACRDPGWSWRDQPKSSLHLLPHLRPILAHLLEDQVSCVIHYWSYICTQWVFPTHIIHPYIPSQYFPPIHLLAKVYTPALMNSCLPLKVLRNPLQCINKLKEWTAATMHFEERKYSCCCFCFSMPLPTIKDDAESSLHMTCNFTELALTESGLSDVQLLKTQHCSCYAACHICIMQDQFRLIFDRVPPLFKDQKWCVVVFAHDL